MKRSLLLALLLTVASGATVQTATAQQNENQMSIRVAGYEVLLNGDNPKGHEHGEYEKGYNMYGKHRGNYGGRIGLIELGGNFLRTYGDSYAAYPASDDGFLTLNPWDSAHITLNLSTFSTSLVRGNRLGVTLGLGFTYAQYGLDNPIPLAKIDRMLYPVESDTQYKSSRLKTFALHLPLALEINPTRDFFISVGGYLDWMLAATAKWKKPKQKFQNPYINPFQVGLTARIGFREVYLFGNYAVTDFFQKGKGPRMNSYSVGVGFGF